MPQSGNMIFSRALVRSPARRLAIALPNLFSLCLSWLVLEDAARQRIHFRGRRKSCQKKEPERSVNIDHVEIKLFCMISVSMPKPHIKSSYETACTRDQR